MPEKRRKFKKEFREGAVRIVRETHKPIAEVARDLGIHPGTLGRWVHLDRVGSGEVDGLKEDERARLAHMDRSGHSLTVLIGPAGTGKTFCLDAARAAWESEGYRVMGTALAARAAVELTTDAGIASQTADRLLNSLAAGRESFDPHTVVVIDEGGMLGTRRLAGLVREADTAGSKVVLVGDSAQLPEIDAGGLFASLSQRLGHIELTTNRRQRDPEEVAIAAEVRARDPEAALSRMQRHGRLATADNADLLRDAMVADWYEARARGEEVLMLASRREVVADLNARVRALLAQRGELGAPVAEVDDVAFSIGDEVMAHHNDYDLGILNAERGVVTGGSDAALVVAVGERSVLLPRAYIEAGQLTHSFAATIHKAQGLSVDRVFVLGDDSFTAEVGYTGLTRGREANQVYVVAPERPDGHGWEPALDPVDAFSAALSRSGAKTAAIDHLGPDPGPAVVVEP
jgi:ATP-dependent exoDNAse (exonuclease V) alpha subunit